MPHHFKGVGLHFKGVGIHFNGIPRHFKGVGLRFKGVAIHFKGHTLRFVLFAAPYRGSSSLLQLCAKEKNSGVEIEIKAGKTYTRAFEALERETRAPLVCVFRISLVYQNVT